MRKINLNKTVLAFCKTFYFQGCGTSLRMIQDVFLIFFIDFLLEGKQIEVLLVTFGKLPTME